MSDATRVAAGALVRRALRGEGTPPVPHLLVRPPGGAEQTVALTAELTVGRDPQAGLVLADAGASRCHARLRLGEDGAAEVEDLGSKNGLRLNGRRLAGGRAALRHGDELLLGATVLRFVDPLAASAPGAAAQHADQARSSGGPGAPDRGRGAGWSPAGWVQLAIAAGLLGLSAGLLLIG